MKNKKNESQVTYFWIIFIFFAFFLEIQVQPFPTYQFKYTFPNIYSLNKGSCTLYDTSAS